MNEGQFNEVKRLLGELIKRHDRMIELLESQMTQPVQTSNDAVRVAFEKFDKMTRPAKTMKATKK